jgi:hypothetical protein
MPDRRPHSSRAMKSAPIGDHPAGYCGMPIGNSHHDDITGSEAAPAERFGGLRLCPKQHSHQQTHIYTNTGEKLMPPTTIACPTTRPTLSAGATGGSVVTMQQKINARLTILGAPGALTLVPDGDFGPKTLKAAKYIQCVAFLDIDGIVGCDRRSAAFAPVRWLLRWQHRWHLWPANQGGGHGLPSLDSFAPSPTRWRHQG